ncbi:hypothetical protein VTK56DRAFT_3447 [Thermocarpiscus australiensis]
MALKPSRCDATFCHSSYHFTDPVHGLVSLGPPLATAHQVTSSKTRGWEEGERLGTEPPFREKPALAPLARLFWGLSASVSASESRSPILRLFGVAGYILHRTTYGWYSGHSMPGGNDQSSAAVIEAYCNIDALRKGTWSSSTMSMKRLASIGKKTAHRKSTPDTAACLEPALHPRPHPPVIPGWL